MRKRDLLQLVLRATCSLRSRAIAISVTETDAAGFRGIRVFNWAGGRDADKVSVRMSAVLRNVAELELLQTPGLPFSVPRDLACRPVLTGAL